MVNKRLIDHINNRISICQCCIHDHVEEINGHQEDIEISRKHITDYKIEIEELEADLKRLQDE